MARHNLTTAHRDPFDGKVRVTELFSARPKIRRDYGESKTVEVIYSGRAYAAARMALAGAEYSVEDAADCAALDVSRLVTAAPDTAPRCTRCSAPAAVSFPVTDDYGDAVYVLRCHRHGRTGRRGGTGARPLSITHNAHGECVPEHGASFTAIYRRALNYKAALDARRAAERRAFESERGRMTTNGAGEAPESQDPTTDDPNTAAHDRARGLLEAIGAPRLGRGYPVAYAAASAAYGLHTDDNGNPSLTVAVQHLTADRGPGRTPVAVTRANGEKRLQRSRLSLTPYIGHHDRSALADMLGVTYREPGATHTAPLPESFGVRVTPDGWKVTPDGTVATTGDTFPNVPADRATVARADIGTRTVEPNPADQPAAWTRHHSATGRARLATRAAQRDARRTAALSATTS